MMNVMKRAWEIARAAENESGYRAVEFIAEALRMAWAEVKAEMTGEKIYKEAMEYAQKKEKECERKVAKRTIDAEGKPVDVYTGEARKALKKEWGVWAVIIEQLNAKVSYKNYDWNYDWFTENEQWVTPDALDDIIRQAMRTA